MRTEREWRPADGVVVHFEPITYREAAMSWTGGSESRTEQWLRLGDMLQGRPGWRCRVGPEHLNPLGLRDPGIWWALGAFDVAVLAVGVQQDGRYRCVEPAHPGAVTLAATTDDVDSWLRTGGRETDAARVDATALGREMASDADRITERAWDVTVTHGAGTFFAVAGDLSAEPPAMAPTLPAVLTAVKQLILTACGGPGQQESRLLLNVTLDWTAAEGILYPAADAPGLRPTQRLDPERREP